MHSQQINSNFHMGCPEGYTPLLITQQNNVQMMQPMMQFCQPQMQYIQPQMVQQSSLASSPDYTQLNNPFIMLPSPSPIPMMMPQPIQQVIPSPSPYHSVSPAAYLPMPGMNGVPLPPMEFDANTPPNPMGDLVLEDLGTNNIDDSLAFAGESYNNGRSQSRGRSRSRSASKSHDSRHSSRSSSRRGSRSKSRCSRSGSRSGSRSSRSSSRVFNYSHAEDVRIPVKNEKKVAKPVLTSAMTKKELVNETLDYLYAVFGQNFDQEGNRGPTVLRVKVKTRGSLEHICPFIEKCVEKGLLSRISCPISTKKARAHIRGYLAYLETIDMEACEKVIELYNEYNKANLLADGSAPFRGISTNPEKNLENVQ